MSRKLLVLIFTAISIFIVQADSAPTNPVPIIAAQAAAPDDIAVTPETDSSPTSITVEGEPRNTHGHPCTIWDQQDIDQLKEQLKTNADVQAAFTVLKTKVDLRITQPLNVPVAEKAADGSWKYTGDLLPGSESPQKKAGHNSHGNSNDIADLGAMYALTGDEKYGEFAKKMLLAYADGYNNYGHPPGWTEKNYRSAQDQRLTGQFLEDGFVLARMAFGYDLIHNLPSFTPAEHAHIRDDLFKPIAAEFYLFAKEHGDYINAEHNRACICTSAVLMAGYASEDSSMIDTALYGVGGTKDAPTGGVFGTHFSEKCIVSDGLWNEGALGYQTGIASCGLFNDAETLWHHGIDMYRYRNGALKRMLDSAINLAYPNDQMTVAALRDASRFALLDDRGWLNNEVGVPYEYGYRRYKNPSYLPIVRNATKSLSMTIHAGPPSLFQDLPDKSTDTTRPVTSVNYYSVGYGTLRLANGSDPIQLLMEYGVDGGSHSHPSKLAIDLYALGDAIIPFPGVIFPYNDPLDVKWYKTTLSNSTVTVDLASQICFAARWKYPKDMPEPVTTQVVFAPAQTMGLQRGWSDTLYTGVTQDRSLFITNNYMADLFGNFSDKPHTYDLAWHLRGKMTTSLSTTPYQFPESIADGYNALGDVAHATSDGAWTATVMTPNSKTARLVAAASPGTEIITGTGHFFTKTAREDEAPPTIIERRTGQNEALYGNAIDISGTTDGYVKSIIQEGSLKNGYGLLKIQTPQGNDLCFASFLPGQYKAGGLETDAKQAFVQTNGGNVTAMYLAGGKSLVASSAKLTRSAPGLAYIEQIKPDTYIAGNPSPSSATVTIALPALKGLSAFSIDRRQQRIGPAAVTADNSGAVVLTLKAGERVEFSAK